MEARSWIQAADGTDPATGLRAAAALRRLGEQLEAEHVRRARAAGWTWQAIADELGQARQNVHRKYRKAVQ